MADAGNFITAWIFQSPSVFAFVFVMESATENGLSLRDVDFEGKSTDATHFYYIG